MARLPAAARDRVPENQRDAFDELMKGYGRPAIRTCICHGPGTQGPPDHELPQ
jgi:hypothetical protein